MSLGSSEGSPGGTAWPCPNQEALSHWAVWMSVMAITRDCDESGIGAALSPVSSHRAGEMANGPVCTWIPSLYRLRLTDSCAHRDLRLGNHAVLGTSNIFPQLVLLCKNILGFFFREGAEERTLGSLKIRLTVRFSHEGNLAVVNDVSPERIEDDIVFHRCPARLAIPLIVKL